MRVLYYNWADYRDPERRGGGVSVYQRNLIGALLHVDGVETAFLSAGLAHDLRRREPHVVKLADGPSPRYALVNSGIIAPSHADFAGRAQMDHPATEGAFADFVERTGPWDVIHFNNLEGLPANVLNLRRRWPNTRFVLSLHNYYPFCPQVNLWYAERETCADYHAGANCTRCLVARPEPRSIRTAYAMSWSLSRMRLGPGTLFYDRVFRPSLGLAWRTLRRILNARHRRVGAPVPMAAVGAAAGDAAVSALVAVDTPAVREPSAARPAPAQAPGAHPGEAFARRRARFVGLINAHCDTVLCVSDRVRQIALHHGIHASRLQTMYIGSAEAAEWHYSHPRADFVGTDGTVRLAYLGYMRRDKGFHFLMRALKALPGPMARRVRLTVAAKAGDAEAMAALEALRPHLAEVRHVDGYSHADLRALLADVDLGVIPVVWEDNLPQVAIEMHARHIPLLTSDRGGAQELGRNPDFVFRADSIDSFNRVLGRVLDRGVTPADYWAHAIAPTSLPDHVQALLDLYRKS
ncbi:MAG: glycosyltransferase [Rhodobacteraceae bacterium]|nr:glycosyltransferase [Paracoccaceae bacterium]